MSYSKVILLIVGVLMLSGCTMPAELSDDSKNKDMKCTDTRDGEVFYFNTNTVTNIRAGFGTVGSFDIVDTNGTKHTMTSSMESYIKCVETKELNDV